MNNDSAQPMLTITKSGNVTRDALEVAPNAVEVLRYQMTELIRKEAPANFHESMIHWTNKGGDGCDGVEVTATWCDSYSKHSLKDRVKQLED